MSFEIINKNIAEVPVEAIVNSANSKLLISEGVCGSIFSLAGEKELQEECNKIGFCDTGDAVITKGYNLEAKYIIHAVGPVWNEGKDNEAEYLKKAYESSLKLVKDYNIKSVAFPLISAGAKGYPKRDVLDIATSVIKEFLENNDDINIYLAVLNREDIIVERELRRNIRIFKNAVRNSTINFGKNNNCEENSPRFSGKFSGFSDFGDFGDIFSDIFSDKTENGSPFTPKETNTKETDLNKVNEHEEECNKTNTPKIRKIKIRRINTKENERKKEVFEDTLENKLEHKKESFSEYLLKLIDDKGKTDVEVYKKANIDRRLFSKIRTDKNYAPKKTTVLSLAVGLELSLEETEELLKRAGYSLSESCNFDIIVGYFIENKIYDIFKINETLFYYKEKLLSSSKN